MSVATTTRPSSSFRLWSARLDGGVLTKAQCQQVGHAIAATADGRYPHGKRTNITADEAQAIMDRITSAPEGFALLPAQEDIGKRWLTANAKRLGLPVGEVVRFAFVGAHAYNVQSLSLRWEQRWHEVAQYAPVYRTWLADGRVYDYAPTPWQATAYGSGKVPLWWREVGACAGCGNLIVQDHDESGQRGKAWREQSWGDDRDYQCGISVDSRHHPDTRSHGAPS